MWLGISSHSSANATGGRLYAGTGAIIGLEAVPGGPRRHGFMFRFSKTDDECSPKFPGAYEVSLCQLCQLRQTVPAMINVAPGKMQIQ